MSTIERCLIVDTETSGLDDDAQLLELGLILYSVRYQTPLQEFSTLLPSLSNEAEMANNIRSEALAEMYPIFDEDFTGIIFMAMVRNADVLVSHNSQFDSRVVDSWIKAEWSAAPNPLVDHPWLCTMEDFKWPKGKVAANLTLLALDNGVGVVEPHRALTDCRLIASLFDRMENLQDMFRVAMRPKAMFVGLQKREENELAKVAGFKWDRIIKKHWARRMAIEDAQSLPFTVRQVQLTDEFEPGEDFK